VAIQSSGIGYRAYRFPTWRRLVFILGLMVVAVPLGWELMGAVLTAAFGPTPSATEQWLFYWVYRPSADGSAMHVPPNLLWVGLVFAITTVGMSITNRQGALLKAGGKVARLWSSPEVKQRWHAGLDSMAVARVGWTIRYTLRDRVLLALATLGSVLTLAVAATTIASRYGLNPAGGLEAGYRLALGPWLCLGAGFGGLVAVLVALPWRLGSEIAISPNGRVSPVEETVPGAPRLVDAATAVPPAYDSVASPAVAAAAEEQDRLRLAALREFAMSSRTPAQMGRRLGLDAAALTALVGRRELKFSSAAISGNTYNGTDRTLWEAHKQQLFDDLVADKGAAGVLQQASSVTPDWFNTPGGELITNLADFGGLSMSVAAKDRTPIPTRDRRLAWIGLVFVAGLIGITLGLAAPVGWLWQSSYFGWRNGTKAEPRAAIVLGWLGLVPVLLLAAMTVFVFVVGPIILLLGG
jgi:hypothetical protein